MEQNTTDRDLLDSFLEIAKQEHLPLIGRWRFKHTRADGTVREWEQCNVITAAGMNALAARFGADTTSAWLYIAVGTVTAQASLGSTVTQFGEVIRKAAATVTSSKETAILTCSLGGASDSLTGIALGSAACVNHANSGQGTAFNIVNSVDATLQGSDTLALQVEVQVGSHNL